MHRAVGHADQHESASAQVAGLRKDDGEGEAGSDRSVDCVAACFHHVDSGLRGQFVSAHHQACWA